MKKKRRESEGEVPVWGGSRCRRGGLSLLRTFFLKRKHNAKGKENPPLGKKGGRTQRKAAPCVLRREATGVEPETDKGSKGGGFLEAEEREVPVDKKGKKSLNRGLTYEVGERD